MEIPKIAPPEVHAVSPRLADYTDRLLFAGVWEREGLSQRDKSMITCSALIALNRAPYLRYHASRALDAGLKPEELSEIVTHLSLYCGWPMATAAVMELAPIYAERGIAPPEIREPLLEADPGMEDRRKAVLTGAIGQVAPGLAQYSNDVLFGDLWLHPELAPRDRSLVTLAAIWAMGLEPLLDYQYHRAFDNGLSASDLGHALTHAAFYIGWPRAMAAAMVARTVMEERGIVAGA